MLFGEQLREFLSAAEKHRVRFLLVGGGAVNFHGYQRLSADVDLWIDNSPENLERLRQALTACGYEVARWPDAVRSADQNVSIKISPDLTLELITRFDPGCSFDEAWQRGVQGELADLPVVRYRVISYPDLVNSKLRAARPKDLLDVQELVRKRGAPGP